MSTLQVTIAPRPAVEVPAGAGPIFVDAVYSRKIEGRAGSGVSDLPGTIQETLRLNLGANLEGSFTLPEVAPGSPVELCFLGPNGSVRLKKSAQPGDSERLAVDLDKAEVIAVTTPDPQPEPSTPRLDRRAYFVPVSDVRVPFEASTLQVAPITVSGGGWEMLGLDQLFKADSPATSSMQFPVESWSGAGAIALTSVHLGIDGQFAFSVVKGAGDAWLWWLTGPLPAIGVVIDDLAAVRAVRIGVVLPPFAGAAPSAEEPGRVPRDVTESELAANPEMYTEDPGEFCKPFKNPERVLGERSFFVILRAEQPVISAQASVVVDPIPTLAYEAKAATASFSAAGARDTTGAARTPAGSVVSDTADVSFFRHALPTPYIDMLLRFHRGRTGMDAAHPVQWESDASRYQATTVARGHILEYRMRWRSNGYSLGTVAKSLTLAPRQTKRIQKIEWQRSEISRRTETTQLTDRVSDAVLQSRDYDDAVQANLSEWSRGRSESSMSAAAGGFGFAGGGFVIGGGGGGSNAESSSSQEGGRRTAANEQQRLRDSIRRYGDALRKLESMVVSEVTQEETTTGTTELVRNRNYGHSLTVIYYQILRHLKIETDIAGVRECLFVPFAIRPFTIPRAYRWRDLISMGLRDRRQAAAIEYLKDVVTNFASSDVPPGRRSDQPIRYVFGSLFVQLAIDRPKDKEDGSFDPITWVVLHPFLGSPALSVYSKLKALSEALRDAAFQRDEAPTIAASWINTLKIQVGGVAVPLPADFTLATRYQFNRVVRVDFTIPIPAGLTPVTRELMSSIRITATKDLPPGSIANLQSLTFTYETDQFKYTISASQGAGDLVVVETGVRDTAGATVATIPDAWERRDVRAEMTAAVQNLVEHLNEHVEYYHKLIWWYMDRDRLFMLIDGFFAPGANGVSIASVVERDPIAIIGNAVVFRVSAGSFLGLGNLKTPADLFNYYVSRDAISEPMLMSLPTDGLYAQTLMDECTALEEHFGNTDWVFNDPDPELGTIAPELLASRRAEPVSTTPTPFPQTIINLQNAPEMPAPSGLAGALAAVQNANAFRDMAGLAGTQANAAAGFQAAASLASSFGAQAAALKLAEGAKDAHTTQAADQKLATVQRAVDKNLVPQVDAQQHASRILEGLHSPTPVAPHQDPVLSRAVFAASGQPGSTIEATTADGTLRVALGGTSSGAPGASAPTAPPPASIPPGAGARQDGIDIYQGNNMPTMEAMKQAGIRFVIHKSSERTKGGGMIDDVEFKTRWEATGAAGVIRGSYHYYRHLNGAGGDVPAARVVAQVGRLVPGDLAPSLDFENDAVSTGSAEPTAPAWRTEIEAFLDAIETKLGRTPLIYTSVSAWDGHITNNANFQAVDFARFKDYPLWVKHYFGPRFVTVPDPANPGATIQLDLDTPPAPLTASFRRAAADRADDQYRQRQTLQPAIPLPWTDFAILQYSPYTPGVLLNNRPFNEMSVDVDVSQGGLHSLRGLADLGRTSPHMVGNLPCIAYTEADGKLYLLEFVSGVWRSIDVLPSAPTAPLAAGDPAAIGLGNEQVIVYRGQDSRIYALSRSLTDSSGNWTVADITGSAAVGDPFVAASGGDLHVLYWDRFDNHAHLSRTAGAWHAERLAVGVAAGAAVAYEHGNALHAVSRAGGDGHLFDLNPAMVDLTATARDAQNQPPPVATYRPAAYTPAGQATRIVFRALRGPIWQIERDTLRARNLSALAVKATGDGAGTPGAPNAAGSPTAVATDTQRVFYRAVDGAIIEIFDDAGTVKWREVCASAAADPTAFVTPTGPQVTFRGQDGSIRLSRLENDAWVCEHATRTMSPSPSGGGLTPGIPV
ncbi:MAG: hypothetical protein HY788_10050 [Deltaproteobacteria bacterium]|nr:hypothetical protein [Deltaproteobacteria bacterium]